MVEQAISIPLTGRGRYVVAAISLAVAFLVYVFVTQSTRSDVPDHGDWWTETTQIIAARNFTLYGFSSLRYGATRDNGPEVGLPPAYYTPWPSFPAVVLGQLYNWGLSTSEARILPLLISSSALLAIYLLGRQMLGDWRAGIIASLALAASAPFRLLADSLAYPSYDFAAKTWTMLFITLGGLSTGRRRLAWLAVAGVGAFATIGLAGFEMVLAIAAYSILFPLFLASSTSTSQGRLRPAFLSALFTGTGLVAGMLLRLAQNVWLFGGWEPAIDDFADWFLPGVSSGFSFTWQGVSFTVFAGDYLIYYSTILVDRVVAYFPIHLTAIALFFCLAGLLASPVDDRMDWRPIKWLEIVFFSEMLWFLVFRQHTNEHVHTISHLSLSVSLAVAIAFALVWRATSYWTVGRVGITLVGTALLLGSLADVGIKPHGNLQRQIDWTQQRQQVETFASLTPPNAMVVMALGNRDPIWELFIGRTFIRRPGAEHLDDSRGRPWFLLTEAKPGNPSYRNAMEKARLITKTDEIALFDMNPSSKPSTLIDGVPGTP